MCTKRKHTTEEVDERLCKKRKMYNDTICDDQQSVYEFSFPKSIEHRSYTSHQVQKLLEAQENLFKIEKETIIQCYETKLLEQYDVFSNYCSDNLSQNNKLQDYVS